MKRLLMFFSLILFLAMLVINLPFITAAAGADEQVNVYDEQKQLVKSVVFVIGLDQYFVDGQTPGVKMDAKPFIEQGRTFVPVRYLGNALGVDDDHIAWESPRATFNQPGFPEVELAVGSKEIKSDGMVKTMDTAPLLKAGRTYLPARWVAEALGYQVAWDAKNNVVICWPQGAEKPDVSAVLDYLNGEGTTTPVAPGNKVNGYTVPANTDLNIFPVDEGGDPKGYIVFSINLKTGNLQQQYTDAQSIISQTVDPDTTNKVIEFAKETQEELLSDKPWDIKTFNSPNGMAVRVGGGWGGDNIQFDIWSTK